MPSMLGSFGAASDSKVGKTGGTWVPPGEVVQNAWAEWLATAKACSAHSRRDQCDAAARHAAAA